MQGFSLARRRDVLFATAAVMAAGSAGSARAAPKTRVPAPLLPDDTLADHGPLIQAAVDDAARAEGGAVAFGPGVFRCRSSILIDPTKTSLLGDRTELDFSAAGPDFSAGLIVSPSAQSTQYGQATQRIEGISLSGPGSGAAVLFRASEPNFSARISLRNLDIVGFGDGLRFEDRAYLIQIYSTAVRGCTNAVHAPANLVDAGENIAFFGCTLSASAVAINNQGGFELNFFGTSFDFVGQWYSGTGLANFHGCHFEMARPKAAAPLFDVTGDGVVNFFGGAIMVSGNDFDPSPKNATVFNLQGARARAMLDGTAVYNLRSAAGVLSAGNGRLATRGLNGGAVKELAPMLMNAPRADLFGGAGMFSGPAIMMDTDVSSGDAQDRSRYEARYGSIGLAPNMLKIFKTGGVGNELRVRFFCPVAPLRIPSVALQWKPLAAAASNAIFWITLSAVQKIGQDEQGRTRVGTSQTLGPLRTLAFNGGDAWNNIAIDTLTMDAASDTDGYTSDWTTHLCITIELIELPENSGILISNLHACAL